MQKMKRKILYIFSVLLIITAIGLFLYPDISKHIVNEHNKNISERFDEISEDYRNGEVKQAEDDGITDVEGYLLDENDNVISDCPVEFARDIDGLKKDSISYNKLLREHQDMDCDFSRAALDMNAYGIYDGIYGYISAPVIGMNVPIYLGADQINMINGAAHLYNTSLPLGGEDTNAVFAGHTGYFGRTIFDNLPDLKVGDQVSVTTFFDTLDYRVVSGKEISATATNDIYIVKGKDLITLITCASRGKTRFEVICERVE